MPIYSSHCGIKTVKLIELFRLAEGSEVITQTSAAYDVDYNGETYSSYPLGRTAPEDKDKLERANLELEMDISNPLAQRYLVQPVDRVVTLTIFRKEDDDEPYPYWKGRLATNKPGSNGKFVMSFETVFTSMRRPGLRARVQRTCRHVHYGRGCKLQMENFRFDTALLSADGITVTVASVNGAADNTYKAGIIKASDGTMRYIRSQIGTTLLLARPFEVLNTAIVNGMGYGNNYGNVYGGIGVAIYPGCAHNEAACLSFDNLDNMGGFSRLPLKNPVGGSSIM